MKTLTKNEQWVWPASVSTHVHDALFNHTYQAQDVTQGQHFIRSFTGLNSEFSFSYTGYHTKDKEPYYFLEGE